MRHDDIQGDPTMFDVTVKGYQTGQDVGHNRPEATAEEAVRAAVLQTPTDRLRRGGGGKVRIVAGPEFSSSILGGKGGYVTHVEFIGWDLNPQDEQVVGKAEVWASVRDESKAPPQRKYSNRMEVRYGDQEKEALARLTTRAQQDNSTVVRDLLLKAAFTNISFQFAPAAPLADQVRQIDTLKSKYSMTSTAGVANAYLPIQPGTEFTVVLNDWDNVKQVEEEIRGMAGVDLDSISIEVWEG